ncbi:MAG: hypothetical protein WCC57_02825 [Paracoccaceae bacterium]
MDIKGLFGKFFRTFFRRAVDSGVKAATDYASGGKSTRRSHGQAARATAKRARKAARLTRRIGR